MTQITVSVCRLLQAAAQTPPDAEATAEGVHAEQPASLTVPTLLLRVLRANAAASTRPTDLLVLAAHAAMLETGFAPAWAQQAASAAPPDSPGPHAAVSPIDRNGDDRYKLPA